MPISPRLVKRLISAAVLIPLALVCLVYEFTFAVLVLTVFLIAVWEWIGLVRVAPRYKALIAAVGVFYLPLSFLCFTGLRFLVSSNGEWLIFMMMVAVWLSDTGAYVCGKWIGGPKLAPRLSPNKTWAGLGGAMLFPPLTLFLIWAWGVLLGPLPEPSVGHINGLGICLLMIFLALFGLVCQMGDLFISLFKRLAGVKDTSDLIPGHGGVLDRIDSLMLASIVTPGLWYLLKITMEAMA